MCVQAVDDRCGRTGVRPVSFSEVEYARGREGGEYVILLTNACSYRSVINLKESVELELLLLIVYSGLSVYLGLLKQDGQMQL